MTIKKKALKMTVSETEYSIHRFNFGSSIPPEVVESEIFFIGKTDEELSIVCDSSIELNSPKSVRGWSYIKVMGPLDFNIQGVLSGITAVLAKAGIGICAISTFDTDYIFVPMGDLKTAQSALEKAGYEFV